MDIISLDLFVFGTGIGERGNLNFCCPIRKEEDKISLLKLIQPLLTENSSPKSQPIEKKGDKK